VVARLEAELNWIEVEFQGRRYRVPALKHQGRLGFHWQGETHVVESAGSSRAKSGDKAGVRPGVIVAPMPGKITRVAVKKGDAVSKGQALVVMEAMKMEYTLEADRDGKAEEVAAQTGKQVTLGEVLVRLGDK
jgi:acetyl/propionyl-CoA carboxylase alpha subunit